MHDIRQFIDAVQPLTEVALTGDHPFHWQQRTEKLWNAFFEVGQRQIEIIFTRISGSGAHSYWRVDFRRRTYPDERGSVKETTLIISTVAAAIRAFLDTVQPERLKMSPTGQNREKLYRAVLHRVMPTIGTDYSLDENWYGTLFGEFELNRKPDMDDPLAETRRYTRADYEHILNHQRELEGLRAAMRDPQTGQVYVGSSHQAAIEKVPPSDETGVWAEWDLGSTNTGFVNRAGEFISRDEAERRWDVLTIEDVKDKLRAVQSWHKSRK